uniref:Uncharacterized protein n=1 Tax=Trichogramma kaykai TaxID=54128 RepID=A0ABD2XHY0_9HYME
MKNAIWSTYYHYSSNDDNPKHQNCPRDENSWCEWQKAAIKGEFKSFKHSYAALPTDVLVAVKPIYEDLSKDSLLERCVKGFTQNNNESLNQIIWKITPKILSGTSNIVEIAANVASCVFNEGCFALLAFLEEMCVSLGPSAHEWARLQDMHRITRADKKLQMQLKKAELFVDKLRIVQKIF